jgi:hypothetical protein
MIAISYRREDSLPTAGRLYDRLQAKFGKKNVFMDFDSIPPGMDFREQIKQMIERSNLVIAIIGPHCLGEQPDASRRIDNPADFVRLEIAYALERGIPVIPVLVNNTPMPPPEKLPQEIEGLAFRNAVTLDTGIDFHHHADRLIAGIRKAMVVAPRSGERQEGREPTPVAVHRRFLRKIFMWSAAILLAVVASATWFLAGHRQEQGTNATSQSVGPTASAPTPTTELSPGVGEAQENSAVVSETTSPPAIAEASPAKAVSPAPVPSPATTYSSRKYRLTGPLVDSGSGYLVIRKGFDQWYIARTPSTVVTGDLKPGYPVSVEYYMVMPEMYSDFKTYSVTGTILEDNKAMVAVQKGKDRWEISHEDGRFIGATGEKVTLKWKAIASRVTAR